MTTYPSGGSTFDGDEQGWVDEGARCLVGGIELPLLCQAGNAHDAEVGNGPGSIGTEVSILLSLLDLMAGDGTWTSPPFTVSPGQVIDGATFSYDRRFEDGALVSLAPVSTVTVDLIDDTAGTSTTLLSEELGSDDSDFERVSVPAAVVAGHTYRLRLHSTTATTLLGLSTGSSKTQYDNVALAVSTSTPPGNGGGNGSGDDNNGNSPGVKVVRGPYSNSEINVLINQYAGRIGANAGTGADGSLIPLERCTIVGTPDDDVIRGTSGNDVICGLGGNDVITGGGGRDVIDGANGNDWLSGGIGRDLLFGLAGNDRIDGGADADRIGGGSGNDRIEAGNGNDVAHGGAGNDTVGGEAGADRLRGGAGNDRINGGPGNDRLWGDSGRDVLRGLSGFDRINGGSGHDRILSRDGRPDIVHGGAGPDRAVADRKDRIRSVLSIRRK